jgi:lysylphosphatidylglycerol synthetase-like protein (DUF2156 family)
MHRWKPASRSMVIVYFGGFVLLWSGVVAGLLSGRELAAPGSVLPFHGAHPYLTSGIVGLALHAAVVALLAWKADRWFFAHGPLAVVLAGAPLIPLVENLWLVPAFLYLIAVLHVWLASLHESHGKLQASRRSSAPTGARDSAAPPRNPGPPAPAGGSRA